MMSIERGQFVKLTFGGFEGAALYAVGLGQRDLQLCRHLRREAYNVARRHYQHLKAVAVQGLAHHELVAVGFLVNVSLHFSFV